MRRHGRRAARRQFVAHIATEKAIVLSMYEARCKRRSAPVMTDDEARRLAREVTRRFRAAGAFR